MIIHNNIHPSSSSSESRMTVVEQTFWHWSKSQRRRNKNILKFGFCLFKWYFNNSIKIVFSFFLLNRHFFCWYFESQSINNQSINRMKVFVFFQRKKCTIFYLIHFNNSKWFMVDEQLKMQKFFLFIKFQMTSSSFEVRITYLSVFIIIINERHTRFSKKKTLVNFHYRLSNV